MPTAEERLVRRKSWAAWPRRSKLQEVGPQGNHVGNNSRKTRQEARQNSCIRSSQDSPHKSWPTEAK
eukprot:11036218-Alexandrium_andersonii.AAC.1